MAAPARSFSKAHGGIVVDSFAADAYIPTSLVDGTTRTETMVPPEARAIRAATGMARSAPAEPSRGTNIRLNIVLLLSTSLSLSTHVVCSFSLRRAYPCPLTATSQEEALLSQ